MKTLLLTSLLALIPLGFTSAESVPPSLPIILGTNEDAARQMVCTVTATGQKAETLREIQLRIAQSGTKEKGSSSSTRVVTLRTGRTKTVGQVCAILSGALRKFVVGAPDGSLLGKLGSLEKGGEVAFVSETPQVFRIDFKSSEPPAIGSAKPVIRATSMSFTRTEADGLAAALAAVK